MILTVDIGTSSAKAAVFERSGVCRGVARLPVEPSRAQPPYHEIDPLSWIETLKALSTSLATYLGGSLGDVECVAVSGNGPTLVPVDAEGDPVCGAITWLDRRSAEEADIAATLLGRYLDPAFNLPKVLWLRSKRPELFARTRRFSSCPEFVCGWLTGEWATSLPAEGYQDIIWDSRTLAVLGLDEGLFPPFIGSAEILGRALSAPAASLGIPAGVPVVLCGPDFISALAGTATTAPGRACDRSGTSEGINLCWDSLVPRDSRLLFMPHFRAPYENISGVISTTGRALAWFSDLAGLGSEGAEAVFGLAGRARPGAAGLLFLPYLAGERAPLWNPDARGSFLGLNLGHGLPEMARAVAESAGFAMRDVITVMESLGARVEELRVTGQPAGNRFWNGIKADITGKPVLVPAFREAELLGDLCFALAALKAFASPWEAAEELVKIDDRIEPDPAHAPLYDRMFELYRQSYESMRPLYPRFASLGTGSS